MFDNYVFNKVNPKVVLDLDLEQLFYVRGALRSSVSKMRKGVERYNCICVLEKMDAIVRNLLSIDDLPF